MTTELAGSVQAEKPTALEVVDSHFSLADAAKCVPQQKVASLIGRKPITLGTDENAMTRILCLNPDPERITHADAPGIDYLTRRVVRSYFPEALLDEKKQQTFEPVLFAAIDFPTPEIACMWAFSTSRHYRQEGIATDFYVRLERMLASKGYRYLLGGHAKSSAAAFYLKNRYLLDSLQPQLRDEIESQLYIPTVDLISIKFLRPTDALTQVRPEERELSFADKLEYATKRIQGKND